MGQFALNKKAKDVVILDIKKISNICDYHVICSGDSSAQVKAIYQEIIGESKKEKIEIFYSEADNSCRWMLIDYASVIVHIFSQEAREFYNLEYLWKQAKKIKLPE